VILAAGVGAFGPNRPPLAGIEAFEGKSVFYYVTQRELFRGKRPHREREHLVQERLRIENRIEALLFTQGIRKRPSLRSWARDVAWEA
jgi:hypothetical protein